MRRRGGSRQRFFHIFAIWLWCLGLWNRTDLAQLLHCNMTNQLQILDRKTAKCKLAARQGLDQKLR